MMAWKLVIPLFAFVAIAAFVVLFGQGGGGAAAALATSIVSSCSSDEGDRTPCYETEVPALYPAHSVAEVFDVVREVRARDPAYQFCHVLAHKLGERVVAEDSTQWVDAIPLNPSDGLCSNGFIHGVIGGRFRAEVLDNATLDSLVPDFSRACEVREAWRPSDLDRAMCYHGMGHLYVFITNAGMRKALAMCEATAPNDLARMCYEGVFMQIYQPLEPDDLLLIEQMPIKPTKETVREYCATFKDPQYVGACLRESWPFFTAEVLDGSGASRFCSGQPNADEEFKCYQAVTAIIGRVLLDEPSRAIGACGALREEWRELCFGSVARAIVEEDRTAGEGAVSFCRSIPEPFVRTCFFDLADKARFIFGGDAERRRNFCAILPSELQEVCMRR